MNFPDKDPDEIITVTFDFSTVADTLSSAEITVSVLAGLPDAAPTALLSGALSISDALVIQRIAGGQTGTTYALRCVAHDADGEVHVLTAALPVKTAVPM